MLSAAMELALSMVEMEEEHFDLHNNPAYEADIELQIAILEDAIDTAHSQLELPLPSPLLAMT